MKIAVIALSLALTACANVGPTNSPQFGAMVQAALPPDAGPTLVSGPGTWTANSRHMAEFQNNGSIIPDAMPWKDGVTVIAASGLLFAEWDQTHRTYVVIKRIPRANIAAVTLDQMGVSCALVVQEASDSSFHLFDFVRAGGALNDCAMARRAADALNTQPPSP